MRPAQVRRYRRGMESQEGVLQCLFPGHHENYRIHHCQAVVALLNPIGCLGPLCEPCPYTTNHSEDGNKVQAPSIDPIGFNVERLKKNRDGDGDDEVELEQAYESSFASEHNEQAYKDARSCYPSVVCAGFGKWAIGRIYRLRPPRTPVLTKYKQGVTLFLQTPRQSRASGGCPI